MSIQYELVGVDPDGDALKVRVQKEADLDEYHIAPINDAEFPDRCFDVIYCAYVLEHVVGVQAVLDKFARWAKPRGLIVLRIPDGRSVYGFIARYTPHWLHILVKRYVYGNRNAGKTGFGPYPVVYEVAMSLAGIQQFCREYGFEMSVTANGRYLKRARWITPFVVLISVLSLGTLSWRHSDLAILIRT